MPKEERQPFVDTVTPQKIGETFYVRMSTRSKLKSILKAALGGINKPILLYQEDWCEYHDGWHVTLRIPNAAELKCHENELFKQGVLKKPKKEEGKHLTF